MNTKFFPKFYSFWNRVCGFVVRDCNMIKTNTFRIRNDLVNTHSTIR